MPYKTEAAMVSDIMKNVEHSNGTHDILGGLVFLHWNGSGIPANLTYKIRLSASPRNSEGEGKQKFNPFGQDTRWMTTLQFPLFQKVGPREKGKTRGGLPGVYGYILGYFHKFVRSTIDIYILNYKNKILPDVLNVALSLMGSACRLIKNVYMIQEISTVIVSIQTWNIRFHFSYLS